MGWVYMQDTYVSATLFAPGSRVDEIVVESDRAS
jgi:hypothetical protein